MGYIYITTRTLNEMYTSMLLLLFDTLQQCSEAQRKRWNDIELYTVC